MLKISLLTAAAAFVITAAAPISSHAAESGLRQIVVDPSAAGSGSGGGGGDGSGGGTGGGGQNGTGGGKNKKLVIKPLVAEPSGTPAVDPATGGAPVDAGAPADVGDIGKAKGPVATLGDKPGNPDALDAILGAPAVSGADKLDAITSDKPGGAAPIEVNPAEAKPADQGGAPAVAKVEGAPAVAKVEGAPIKDVGGLIVALKTSGFVADIDHRDSKGDYYVVVTTPKDHQFGYLLTVDDKNGKVLEKKKIDPTEYGYYAESNDYSKPKTYEQPESSYSEDNSYGGDDSYGSGSGSGGYGSGGGSGY